MHEGPDHIHEDPLHMHEDLRPFGRAEDADPEREELDLEPRDDTTYTLAAPRTIGITMVHTTRCGVWHTR